MSKIILLISLLMTQLFAFSKQENEFLEAMALREKKEFEKSRKILEHNAKSDPKSMYYLGTIAESGEAKLNKSDASTLYTESCSKLLTQKTMTDLDNWVLGDCYDSDIFKKDRDFALSYYQKGSSAIQNAAKTGNPWALYRLSQMFLNGIAVTQNKSKAIQTFESACQNGSARSCLEAGYAYQDGDGIEKNDPKAEQLFSNGCEKFNGESCNELGRIYAKRDDTSKSIQTYQKGCDLNSHFACHNLGYKYANGQGVPQNKLVAAELFAKSIQAGRAINLDDLVFILQFGSLETFQSIARLKSFGHPDQWKNNNDQTLLIYACSYGRVDIVKLLVQLGANVNVVDKKNDTSIDYAYHNREIVKFLIENGLDVNKRNSRSLTPLMEVVVQKLCSNNFDLIDLLLSKGANINALYPLGLSAFTFATIEKDSNLAKYLLAKGAQPRVKDLWESLKANNMVIANHLINEYGMSVNSSINNDSLALLAAKEGNIDVLKLLYEKNAYISSEIVAASHDQNTASYLLSKTSTDEYSALNALLNYKNYDVFTTIRNYNGISINRHFNIALNSSRFPNSTFLMMAVIQGSYEEVHKLIQDGADLYARDDDGRNLMDYLSLCENQKGQNECKFTRKILKQKGMY